MFNKTGAPVMVDSLDKPNANGKPMQSGKTSRWEKSNIVILGLALFLAFVLILALIIYFVVGYTWRTQIYDTTWWVNNCGANGVEFNGIQYSKHFCELKLTEYDNAMWNYTHRAQMFILGGIGLIFPFIVAGMYIATKFGYTIGFVDKNKYNTAHIDAPTSRAMAMFAAEAELGKAKNSLYRNVTTFTTSDSHNTSSATKTETQNVDFDTKDLPNRISASEFSKLKKGD